MGRLVTRNSSLSTMETILQRLPGHFRHRQTACSAQPSPEVADGSSRHKRRFGNCCRRIDYEEIDFEPEVGVLLSDICTRNTTPQRPVCRLDRQAVLAKGFIWPHKGNITSPYGIRRLYDGELSSYHAGLDIDGNIGDPVSAASSGKVVLAETCGARQYGHHRPRRRCIQHIHICRISPSA